MKAALFALIGMAIGMVIILPVVTGLVLTAINILEWT
jgi:hypothetical protein